MASIRPCKTGVATQRAQNTILIFVFTYYGFCARWFPQRCCIVSLDRHFHLVKQCIILKNYRKKDMLILFITHKF